MTFYIIGSAVAGMVWLTQFLADKETPKTHLLSWIVLLVAALLWPISVPLACIELIEKFGAKDFQGDTTL